MEVQFGIFNCVATSIGDLEAIAFILRLIVDGRGKELKGD